MEPIAVDAPVKVPTIPGPKPVPSLKVEPPKVVAPAADPIGSGWAMPSRKHLTIGVAAVCSLIAGIAAVRLISPSKPEEKAAAPTQSLAAAPQSTPSKPPAPVETPQPKPTPDPRSEGTGLNIPKMEPLPTYPSTPVTPPLPTATIERTPTSAAVPPVVPPSFVPPITPPSAVLPPVGPASPSTPGTIPLMPEDPFKSAGAKKEPQPYTPPVTPYTPPPVNPYVVPIGAQEPPKPATVMPPGMVPLPPLPGDNTTLPLPSAPKIDPVPLPGTNPIVPPKQPVIPSMLPLPANTTPMVPLPMNTTPTVPLPMNTTPTSPVMPPPSVVPPISVTPMSQMPPPFVPPITPTDPNAGRTIEYTKPINTPEARPAVTSFDVDLYDPRLGDSYESISKEFYNDSRYSAALREYNRNKSLQGAGAVEVPPMHVLRKRYPLAIGGTAATPTSFPSAPPPVRPVTGSAPDNWTTPGTTGSASTDLSFRSSAGSYRVPAGGSTFKQIAKETLGTDARWSEIWELNRQITDPSVVLPSGTEVKLPPGAKVGP